MASRTSSQIVQETLADILDQASSERLCVLDDLIQQRTHAKLRQVERAVDRMLNASYGICHLCGADIPLPRLLAQPDATLCVDCKGECEQRTLRQGGS